MRRNEYDVEEYFNLKDAKDSMWDFESAQRKNPAHLPYLGWLLECS